MSEPPEETPAEKEEARAIRRRWLTIGELVAVAGVVIAGLGLWNSWSDKPEATANTPAAKVATVGKPFLTPSAPAGNGDVTFTDAGNIVQGIEIRFPSALNLPERTALAELRISKSLYEKAILAVTDGGPDVVEGRLPILLTSIANEDTGRSERREIYDIFFVTEGRLLSGRSLRVKRFVRRQHVEASSAHARLDQLWAVEAKRLAALKN